MAPHRGANAYTLEKSLPSNHGRTPSLQPYMKEIPSVLFPRKLALIVKRVVTALRCTYPQEKETNYSLELRLSGRVQYAVRREVILDDLSKAVLYQLEETGSAHGEGRSENRTADVQSS